MPKNKSAFIRYRTIDRCLRNSMHPYPAKEFLRDKCEYELFGEATGDKISVSSIEKDLEAMRNDAALGFFAPIKYHRVRQGYYYAEPGYSIEKFPLKPEEEDALKFASLTLVQYKNIPIFGQFQEAIDKIYAMLSVSKNTPPGRAGQVIHFETAGSSAGASLLQQFFHAISHDLLVEFDYDNIYKNEQKHFCVHPYLLKEVRRKWYVLAWYEKHAVYLTFALDRVKDFRATETFQKKRDDFDPEKIFRYSTGIMGDSGGELVDLLIEVKMPNSKMLEENPMHHSQRIEERLPDGIRVSMKVVNSPEIRNQLLSFGSKLIVLAPEELRNTLQREALLMLENYTR